MNLTRLIVAVLIFACLIAAVLFPVVGRQNTADWPMGGQNLSNTRNQPFENIISAQNVDRLVPKWVFTTGGDVSATPAVVGDAVYVPDWQGNFYRIDARTGNAIWSRRVSDYTGFATAFSRTSPAVDRNVVYIGAQSGVQNIGIRTHPALIAVNTATGDPVWVIETDTQPGAIMTQSPVVYNGVVYAGVSSQEEITAALGAYSCCVFRGSFLAVDARSGRIIWRTYLTPDNQGRTDAYSGVSVWGSTPVVDAARGAVYIATGNNYTVPPAHEQCVATGGGVACNNPDNHFDSIVALNLADGTVKWSTGVNEFDAWTFSCITPLRVNCPVSSGPDADFGSGPNLFTVTVQGQTRQLLGVGAKNAIYRALDPDTGHIVWATLTGPRGTLGGIQWGTAADGQRVYVANANSNKLEWTLLNGQTVRGGFWSALDAATGRILWQTADPADGVDMGPVTVANGVVYVGSGHRTGRFYGLDASSGNVLWNFASGGAVVSAPAVVNGVVYWGSGYTRWNLASNNKLYAFALQ